MSPGSRWGTRSLTVAAGTINQIARGVSSFFTRSAIDEAPTALARLNSSTAFGNLSKTTHLWPPARSRRVMFAPIRPNPIIPSCIVSSIVVRGGPSGGPGSLEDLHEAPVSSRDLRDCVFPRGLLVPPSKERLPEVRLVDREADEAGHTGSRRQPLAHLVLAFALPMNDARDVGPAPAASGSHDLPAVLAAVEPFDLPDIRLDAPHPGAARSLESSAGVAARDRRP